MVSTEWSAASPESLEVKVCVVIPRGRRTPEDLRLGNRWSGDGEDSDVDGPEVQAVMPGREWMSLLVIFVVPST